MTQPVQRAVYLRSNHCPQEQLTDQIWPFRVAVLSNNSIAFRRKSPTDVPGAPDTREARPHSNAHLMKPLRQRTLTNTIGNPQMPDRLRRAAIRRAMTDGRLDVPVDFSNDFPEAAVRFEKLGVDPATLAQFCREANDEFQNAPGRRLDVRPLSNFDE
jgi:hypothetical protein